MKYTINSNEQLINWNAKGRERIAQNVNNILNTLQNEVPYLRSMGRNPENIDSITTKTRYALTEETYDLINEYEPRALVKSVQIEEGETPNIKVVIESE